MSEKQLAPPTPEQQEIMRSRFLSDAEHVKKGADAKFDGSSPYPKEVHFSKEQKEDILKSAETNKKRNEFDEKILKPIMEKIGALDVLDRELALRIAKIEESLVSARKREPDSLSPYKLKELEEVVSSFISSLEEEKNIWISYFTKNKDKWISPSDDGFVTFGELEPKSLNKKKEDMLKKLDEISTYDKYKALGMYSSDVKKAVANLRIEVPVRSTFQEEGGIKFKDLVALSRELAEATYAYKKI